MLSNVLLVFLHLYHVYFMLEMVGQIGRCLLSGVLELDEMDNKGGVISSFQFSNHVADSSLI